MNVRSIAIPLVTVVLMLPFSAFAESDSVTYQGVLTDSAGMPVADGAYAMEFGLWVEAVGGDAPVWTESHANVTVNGGVFSVDLGLGTPFATLFSENPTLWLEITADLGGGLETFSPRSALNAAPFAFHAANASAVESMSVAEIVATAAGQFAGGGAESTLSGGFENTAAGFRSAVGGGQSNAAGGSLSTVGGGSSNSASGAFSNVAGGQVNQATMENATVSGGQNNTANNVAAYVGGGVMNLASGLRAAVVGGQNNGASGTDAAIAGGRNNVASGNLSNVGGGISNNAGAINATIAGGRLNTASGGSSTVAGGEENLASMLVSTVGGGFDNDALAEGATVAGGQHNTANGMDATVPGGSGNTASGVGSFAAGTGATAGGAGTFVWGDSTTDGPALDIPENDVFAARASGGVFFYSSSMLDVGVHLPAGAGAWADLSDRNAKENFEDIDPAAVLEKVAELPITQWNYKTEQGVRHIGPMAQDFYGAFGVGANARTITTVDGSGVALAAIQGLNEKLETQNRALTARVSELETMLRRLTASLEQSVSREQVATPND